MAVRSDENGSRDGMSASESEAFAHLKRRTTQNGVTWLDLAQEAADQNGVSVLSVLRMSNRTTEAVRARYAAIWAILCGSPIELSNGEVGRAFGFDASTVRQARIAGERKTKEDQAQIEELAQEEE